MYLFYFLFNAIAVISVMYLFYFLFYAIAVISVLSLCCCSDINKKLGLADDNVYEESVEFVMETVIQSQTGVRPSIDLTPASPE